jgi:hypothetical protein
MKTYPVFNNEGIRAPIFQVDNVYVGPSSAAKILESIEHVTEIQLRKAFSKSSDVHVEFKYLNRSYIVWEPYGDNSRYWIGPADMLEGMPPVAALDRPDDIDRLERAFKDYRPHLLRKLIGDVLTLRFVSGNSK